MYKKPKPCPYCGKTNHLGYQCYQKNKILYQHRKKHPVFRKIKPLSATLGSKTGKVSSRKKNEQSERKKLIKGLDKYYSLYVRLKAADKNGLCRCYICGRVDLWVNMDNNHYISRRFQGTRWDLPNMRCGCRVCNRIKNGNYGLFEPKIKQELGVDNVQKLWDKAYSQRKIPTYELAEMLIQIKQEYKDLIETRKAKGWEC